MVTSTTWAYKNKSYLRAREASFQILPFEVVLRTSYGPRSRADQRIRRRIPTPQYDLPIFVCINLTQTPIHTVLIRVVILAHMKLILKLPRDIIAEVKSAAFLLTICFVRKLLQHLKVGGVARWRRCFTGIGFSLVRSNESFCTFWGRTSLEL